MDCVRQGYRSIHLDKEIFSAKIILTENTTLWHCDLRFLPLLLDKLSLFDLSAHLK